MTPTEAVIERIERLCNVLLEKQESLLLMQSDLLESLKSRGKKELPEAAPVKRTWRCDFCHKVADLEARALETPWEGRICRLCADKENGIFPKGGQDLASGAGEE